jgi:hypothetical protein
MTLEGIGQRHHQHHPVRVPSNVLRSRSGHRALAPGRMGAGEPTASLACKTGESRPRPGARMDATRGAQGSAQKHGALRGLARR